MKVKLILIILIGFHLAHSQVRPDQFVEETDPNDSNFEVYSQKDGNTRRASLYNLKRYHTPQAQLTPVVYVPTPTGNTQNLMEFIVDPNGDQWYIASNGNGFKFSGSYDDQPLLDSIAALRNDLDVNLIRPSFDIREFKIESNTWAEALDSAQASGGRHIILPEVLDTIYLDTLASGHPWKSSTHATCINLREDVRLTINCTVLLSPNMQSTRPVDIITSYHTDRVVIDGSGIGVIGGNTANQTWAGGYQQLTAGSIIAYQGDTTNSRITIQDIELSDHFSNPFDLNACLFADVRNVRSWGCGEGGHISDMADFVVSNYWHSDSSDVSVGDGFEIARCTTGLVTNLFVGHNGSGAAFDFFGSSNIEVNGIIIDDWSNGISSQSTERDGVTYISHNLKISNGIINTSGTGLFAATGGFVDTTEGDIFLDNIHFTGVQGSSKGVQYNIPFTGSRINNCTFENFDIGVLYRSPDTLIMKNVTFLDNDEAIRVQKFDTVVNPVLYVQNCDFWRNGEAVAIDYQGATEFNPFVCLQGSNNFFSNGFDTRIRSNTQGLDETDDFCEQPFLNSEILQHISDSIATVGGGGGFTQEEIEDFVGAMGVDGINTTFSYNDGAGTFTFDATGGASDGNGMITPVDRQTIGTDTLDHQSGGLVVSGTGLDNLKFLHDGNPAIEIRRDGTGGVGGVKLENDNQAYQVTMNSGNDFTVRDINTGVDVFVLQDGAVNQGFRQNAGGQIHLGAYSPGAFPGIVSEIVCLDAGKNIIQASIDDIGDAINTLYRGSGTIQSTTISAITDFWRIEGGELRVATDLYMGNGDGDGGPTGNKFIQFQKQGSGEAGVKWKLSTSTDTAYMKYDANEDLVIGNSANDVVIETSLKVDSSIIMNDNAYQSMWDSTYLRSINAYNRVEIGTGIYNVLPTDYLIEKIANTVGDQIVLPVAPPASKLFLIKYRLTSGSVEITTAGSEQIENAQTFTLEPPLGGIIVLFNGTDYIIINRLASDNSSMGNLLSADLNQSASHTHNANNFSTIIDSVNVWQVSANNGPGTNSHLVSQLSVQSNWNDAAGKSGYSILDGTSHRLSYLPVSGQQADLRLQLSLAQLNYTDGSDIAQVGAHSNGEVRSWSNQGKYFLGSGVLASHPPVDNARDSILAWSSQNGQVYLREASSLGGGGSDDDITSVSIANDSIFINEGSTQVSTPIELSKLVTGYMSPEGVDVTTGDGKSYYRIPTALDSFKLVAVEIDVTTAGVSETTNVQIHNVTDTEDLLSTTVSIDGGDVVSTSATTPYVINTSNDILEARDLLRFDVDGVNTTPPQGLRYTITLAPN